MVLKSAVAGFQFSTLWAASPIVVAKNVTGWTPASPLSSGPGASWSRRGSNRVEAQIQSQFRPAANSSLPTRETIFSTGSLGTTSSTAATETTSLTAVATRYRQGSPTTIPCSVEPETTRMCLARSMEAMTRYSAVSWDSVSATKSLSPTQAAQLTTWPTCRRWQTCEWLEPFPLRPDVGPAIDR